jgi:ParB family chromosome partitioning protein
MPKRSLGRGLSDLLSGEAPPRSRTVLEIALDEIDPNPRQPRDAIDEEPLEELARSIESHGVLQPIIVRRRGERYELVAGERRWRAARAAGLESIPCMVQDIDDRTSLQVALIENVQRDNLNELELADGYRCLVEDFGLTQEELAQRIGKSRSAVTNTLRLLDLPPMVQDLIRDGHLSAGHGRALLGLGAPDDDICQFAQHIVEKGLNVRDTEALVREFTSIAVKDEAQQSEDTPVKKPIDPHLTSLAERLQSVLAAKVTIKPKAKRGGTIRITYYDDDDLTRIVEEIDVDRDFL